MKFVVLLLAVALMLGFCGCGPKTKPIEGFADKEPVSFTYTHHGTHAGHFYAYTVTATDAGERFEVELGMHNTADVVVEEPLLQPLMDVMVRWDVGAWNGFAEVDATALDGEGFSLNVTFADGTVLTAHGSNAWPENYGAVETEILALLRPLAAKYAFSHTLESDEPEWVYIRFADGEKLFFFCAAGDEAGGTQLRIEVKNIPGMEDCRFDGTVETFPFEALQAVVRQQDIPAWSGWEMPQGEEEYFSIELVYASGETVTAGGRVHPEGYAETRQALVDLLSGYIEENRETFLSE